MTIWFPLVKREYLDTTPDVRQETWTGMGVSLDDPCVAAAWYYLVFAFTPGRGRALNPSDHATVAVKLITGR